MSEKMAGENPPNPGRACKFDDCLSVFLRRSVHWQYIACHVTTQGQLSANMIDVGTFAPLRGYLPHELPFIAEYATDQTLKT